MVKEYDVIVAGAGVGGLGAAGLLAKAGKKVLLLEKKNNVGGRAATFKGNDGVTRSLGQHAMLENIKYDKLIEMLGVTAQKEYFSDWQMEYEGEFKSGLPHGQGTLTLPTGEKISGEFENGQPVKQN